jgi:SAM-dependent methyltransferase
MQKSKLSGKMMGNPIYRSHGTKSITSLSLIYNGPTIVYLDESIGHLQTTEIESIDKYYDEQYEFFNQSDEDDVLYTVDQGKEIFRQQHQVETLMSKIAVKPGMRILDYGCAKGTVLKRLFAKQPDIDPYLFDVSKAYTRLWDKFLTPDKYASYQPRDEWKGQFDLITSFFAFEHTPDPLKELAAIKSLLKENGLLYIIVPNVFENIGDFIVADHVHHYSEISLRYMFAKAGFETLEIDSKSHFAAFIAICRNATGSVIPFEAPQHLLEKVNNECKKLAMYWDNIQDNILRFEKGLNGQKAAIYGAGVYGNFIGTTLKEFDNIRYFVDQNHLLHGKTMLTKPVIKPEELPDDIEAVYIGLNPKIAREIIENSESWKKSKRSFLYL